MNNSVDVFLRTLNERFNAFKADFESLLKALASNDTNEKNAAAQRTLTSADDVQRSLSENDQPGWLHPIILSLKQHSARLDNANHCYELARVVAKLYARIHNHKWSFAKEDVTGFDFDALYEQCREKSRVPALFDQLIEGLEAIVSSNEVDSRRVIQALDRLIQSLKRSRRGSYFATMATWDFVVGVLHNWLWGELCKVPAIGGLLTAVRETLDETDSEMETLHNEMQTQVQNQIATEITLLAYSHRGLPDLEMIRIENRPTD